MYRGINDFKKGYQPRTNIVNDDKVDLVADCHSILDRWMYYFYQLLNVHGVNYYYYYLLCVHQIHTRPQAHWI